MSHIDQMITEGNLRDVRVFDFNEELDIIEQDIQDLYRLLKRNRIDDKNANSTLSALISKHHQLESLANEWVGGVGETGRYSNYRIVILIEEMPES